MTREQIVELIKDAIDLNLSSDVAAWQIADAWLKDREEAVQRAGTQAN